MDALCPILGQGQQEKQISINEAMAAAVQAVTQATLRYGALRGWLQDETARSSLNIQEAIDCVTHTGHNRVAVHIKDCQGAAVGGLVLTADAMVLVLPPSMVRGTLHAS